MREHINSDTHLFKWFACYSDTLSNYWLEL